MKGFYKSLIIISIIVATILLVIGGILGYFTLTEYTPPALIKEQVHNQSIDSLKMGDSLKIMTFNIGYGGLGVDEDFVMDGGKKGRPNKEETVLTYFAGIQDLIKEHKSDIYFLQEVDFNSRRSYKVNEVQSNMELLPNYDAVFSYNYKANFVPFPFSFKDYIGKVNSGLQTLSKFQIASSFRHQLPGSFAWPVRTVNLKRAMQVNYVDIEDSELKLVVINVHLSAYDDGSMRLQEMAYLIDFIELEYAKGNYVIVGGDFNQVFYDAKDTFEPVKGTWVPMVMDKDVLSDNFSFAVDTLSATCRSLHKPYDGSSDFPYYIIDGFIVSKNIEVNLIKTINHGFLYSDHNPVLLEVTLK